MEKKKKEKPKTNEMEVIRKIKLMMAATTTTTMMMEKRICAILQVIVLEAIAKIIILQVL